ncbi:hypothetical protein LCGC14_2222430 [marine sediment metagenome]|uniref:Uncharacterized protein n=1 Tax=marine sediment metagenome TaxID=412755 RepID=A0A0F9DY35_9ZZZZ
MNLYKSIGKRIVLLVLWLAAIAPGYVLLLFAGMNPWVSLGVVVLVMHIARFYWPLNDNIRRG